MTSTSGRLLASSALVREPVENRQGEKLGSITDLLIDVATGRIAYAVIDCGGFLGIGGKLAAVPWGALETDLDADHLVLNVDRDTLERAEAFDRDSWPDMGDRHWAEQLHAYYGVEPYWNWTPGQRSMH